MKYLLFLMTLTIFGCNGAGNTISIEEIDTKVLDSEESKRIYDSRPDNFFDLYDSNGNNRLKVKEEEPGERYSSTLFINALCDSRFKGSIADEGKQAYVYLEEYYPAADSISTCEQVVKVSLTIKGNLKEKQLLLKEIKTATGRSIEIGER